MTRFVFSFLLYLVSLCAYGQISGRSLSDYIESAKQHSPLLNDYRNQIQTGRFGLQRLKAMYRRSRLELSGDWLFVPVVSKDGGGVSFMWNAQDAADYYGYDLGESSGHLHAGVTWTQPLLGNSSYKVARDQYEADARILYAVWRKAALSDSRTSICWRWSWPLMRSSVFPCSSLTGAIWRL